MVFFDIGSTLIDGPPYGPGKRLATALRLPDSTVSAINECLFTTPLTDPAALGEWLAERFAVDRAQAVAAATELWRAQIDEAWQVPGAAGILKDLAAANVSWAYISNIWPPFYQGFLRFFPEEKQRPSFLSFRLGIAKPDLRIYQTACRALGVQPENTIMIGDTYQNDIAPAMVLGMKTIWLLHRPEKETADLQTVAAGDAPAPDLTLQSIGDLRLEQLAALSAFGD